MTESTKARHAREAARERLMAVHFTSKQLATRWAMSWETLAKWRMSGYGPKFLKIGRQILYPLHEVEAFENSKLKRNTVDEGA